MSGQALYLPTQTLSAECAAASELLAVLQREQRCLADTNFEAYALLLIDKAALTGRLSSLAITRHRQLAALGFAATETGMEQWLTQTHSTGLADWQHLLQIIRSAHEVNRVNGLLLSQQLARNQARLQALGMQEQNASLYGADGQATGVRGRLARAVG